MHNKRKCKGQMCPSRYKSHYIYVCMYVYINYVHFLYVSLTLYTRIYLIRSLLYIQFELNLNYFKQIQYNKILFKKKFKLDLKPIRLHRPN